ncbi:hypothetical protein [Paenibacillus sp. sgz302251]|uniref:hypothetical protein n=1 Tax=Paenibacillus sp. sgz302251 TaxID=3414493 RepID=UPI003C7B7352
MIVRANIVREWHQLCVVFHELLLDGCLDEEKRMEICLKINYHNNKLLGHTL